MQSGGRGDGGWRAAVGSGLWVVGAGRAPSPLLLRGGAGPVSTPLVRVGGRAVGGGARGRRPTCF